MEELGAELDDLRLLGVLENLFKYEGRPGHEIVFVFVARLRDAARYSTRHVEVLASGGQRQLASWVSLPDLAEGNVPLYPVGVLDMLRHEAG